MTQYAYPIDLQDEPAPVAVNGDTVTLSQNIMHFDNTGLYGGEQLSFEWPDHPPIEQIEEDFASIWAQRMDEVIAESMTDVASDDTDALISGLYEQVLAMQNAQEATDAVLCDLYESMRSGE